MPQPPDQANALPETAIAVVGAACHFPGARNCNEFWTNLRDGVESVHFFTDEELLAAGIPEAQLHDPNFVKAAPILQDVGGFDPAFWGISPKDAAVMDPQHRHFLECSYEALEDAGHDPRRFDGTVGVFGGCGANSYLMFNLLTNPKLVEEMGMFLVRHTSNDKDFLTTFTSYKLELEGPSLGVQTACSTSLVAIHLAAQQLLNGECDMALAGGSTIEVPHHNGYRFEQGEILSPDGHCRPFDAASEGTVFGSGAGVVVLRRLADALDDGDTIRAVIRGSAVNNDGARKAGYLAPSVDGQAHAVEEALAVAEVDAESISYVETHGTGTPVGDPIEVTALTQAFRESTTAVDSCSIGSCKSNIGHTDTAAGVASFLKVVEALRHEQLPPSLHFTEPNPLIEFAGSPFRVQATLEAWPRGAQPRRAGVNSLGVGGTNAHVILEEAPLQESGPRSRELQVLTLSAKTPAALDAACARLADHLEQAPETNLADVAFTLQEGRRAMALRRTVVCADVQEAIALLRDPAAQQVRQGSVASGGEGRTAAFLFPGGGALYADMAADLYAKEPGFRAAMDRGFGLLVSEYGLDLQPLLQDKDSAESLRKPSLQLPAIFLVEVALAELWMSWGIRPEAMLGHSLGENSAACVAGVMSFKDALGLVVLRGQLFEQLPEGGMLSVALSEEELRPLLSEDLVVGVHNTPSQSVVSGPPQALAALHEQLLQGDVDCQFLDIDCAAHSPMLDPILQQFEDYLRGITLSPPRTPMLSNRTGTWLKDEEATDPVYWVEHLRHPVLFAENVGELLEKEDRLLLEVGPGKSLASLARQHPSAGQEHTFLSSLRHRDEKTDDLVFLLGTLGQLWNAGATPDWRALHGTDRRLRIPLPTYPFERQDYWIEPGRSQATTETGAGPLQRLPLEDWFSTETWAPITRPAAGQAALVTPQRWLLFLDRHGLGTALAEKLRAADQEVVTVREGDTYYRFAESEFALSPEAGRVDYDSLCNQLAADDLLPDRIVHLWTVTGSKDARPGSSMFHHNEERGFFSLFFLAQALGELDPVPELQLDVVANNLFRIQEDDIAYPEKSLLLGPVGVMPREFAHLRTRCLDLDFRAGQGDIPAPTLELLLDLVTTEVAEPRLATRNGQVFAPATVALPLAEPTIDQAPLPEHGVVLITGGLGGLGLTIAKHFAQRNKARIVLLGRSPFPEEGLWDAWLQEHTAEDPTSRRISKVRALQELGAEVLVAQADVANLEDMRELREKVARRFGTIDGVVHAAGVLEDGVIQMRTAEAAERVFTPKVHGTLVLRDLLKDVELKFFLLCSSTSVALGPAGQVDYVAANAFLNAIAAAEAGKGGNRMVALNWGIWSEVGMARALAERLHGGGAVAGERRIHPLGWFDQVLETSFQERHWRGTLCAPECWLLDEHRLHDGLAVLPGSAYFDLVLCAFRDWSGNESATFEDMQFLQPCEVLDDTPREIDVCLLRDGTGFRFQVQSRVANPEGKRAWTRHAEGKIGVLAAEAQTLDLPALDSETRTDLQEVHEGALPDPQDQYLAFGPRFRALQRIGYGGDTAYARLRLPVEYQADLADHPLHPALLDIGTGCAMDLLEGFDASSAMFVPLRYARLDLHAPLTAELHARLTLRQGDRADSDLVSFHIDLCDPDGKLLVHVSDLQLRRLDRKDRFVTVESGTRNTDSPAERAFLESLAAGIDTDNGMAALDRVLGGGTPPVLTVSSMDMEVLGARQDEAMTHLEDTPEVKFQRPNLSSPYVEPEDAVEEQLVAWWEELLGVEQVGVMDDFFEVGGHSLIAVRLFARIKKKWQLEYPLSLLFEAPTIRLCADMLREEITPAEADGSVDPADVSARKRVRHRYLVPLNDVRNPEKPPFFLVAGMFGNVLNLRHLAAHVGADQPMYALQARGLHGDDRPHRRFEDMARDYLEEIRALQPEGPYLLGGFSGGGITAFEMAQQLHGVGETTSALILLDTPVTHVPNATAVERILIQLARIRRGGAGYLIEWPKKRIAWEFEKRKQKASAEERDLAPAEFRSEMIQEGFIEALEHYELRPYPARITLFRPPLDRTFVLPGGRLADEYREIQDSNNHWDPFAPGGIDCFEVPGDHDSMVLEPHVRVLGDKVRQVLREALAQSERDRT